MHDVFYQYIKNKIEIDQKTFTAFSHYFKPRVVKKNEIVLREGEVCKHNIFVSKGCLKFYSINEQGAEHIRYFAFEGKFGTALSSLINQKPSVEYIQALETSSLLLISRLDFFKLVDSVPQINFIYRDILEMAYITSQQRIYGFQGKNALDQLKWLMTNQPKILTRLSNKVIASYLGITPYTLSRLKANL